MIWLLAAMMAAATVLGVIWPLGRASSDDAGRMAKAMAIYEDQLAELDRDAERGLITEGEARAASVEIKRRMLAAGGVEDRKTKAAGRVAVVMAALFVPLAGFGLYTQVGNPDVASVPFAARGAEQQNAQELQALITELRSRLEADAQGGETEGWELLGSTLMNMGRPRQAAEAFAEVTERADATSATWSQYAEALIAAENGVVTPLASRAIARAQEMDPLNPAATFYRAIEQEQSGSTAQARIALLERVAKAQRPEPWIPVFVNEANRMGEQLGIDPVGLPEFDAPRGPSEGDIAAAADMSPEERQAFILSMVEGLEARLEEEPDDLDGWLQLARALVVLGQQDRAYGALQRAEPLVAELPETDQRRRLVEVGLDRFGSAPTSE